ncbi:MAG TPA: histidine kinase [Verrucomicrobiae bacterium]|nr:histidine kinase [Verrucomicrobiae bacterium]
MDGRSAPSRWIAENPGTVDRLLIGGGFVAGLAAFVNSPHLDDPIVNIVGAIAAGGVIAVVVAWSRRRQRTREDLARRVVLDERMRIARELHDVVAHHVSVMGVQAAGARRIIDKRPDQAAEALATIEATSRQAVVELQRLLGMLRSTDDAAVTEGRPGVGQLATLARTSGDAGLPVELVVEGSPPDTLPATLDLSIYRIVQEALTNAIKHGGAGTRAEVRVRFGQRSVELLISDDGAGSSGATRAAAAGGSGGGRGLVGMRERVGLFGGELSASPRPEGGFVVRAVLPLTGAVG